MMHHYFGYNQMISSRWDTRSVQTSGWNTEHEFVLVLTCRADMIVRVLIFGGFVPCCDIRPPCRGAFDPTPEITVNASYVIEGDIAVTETSTENVTTMDAFRTA